MEKAKEDETDPYLALLDWRNTPTEGINRSPTQRMFGRRTKTLLPTSNKLLQPHAPLHNEQEKLLIRQGKQQAYYNRGARELQDMNTGDFFRIKPTPSIGSKKQWTKGVIDGKVNIRSYNVRTADGRIELVFGLSAKNIKIYCQIILCKHKDVGSVLQTRLESRWTRLLMRMKYSVVIKRNKTLSQDSNNQNT